MIIRLKTRKMENTSTSKCLEVAEKILSVLEDKSVYQRYLQAKKKLNSTQYNSFSQLNAELSRNMQEVQSRKTNTSVSSYVIKELHTIQMQILPNTADLLHDTVEESIASLLSVIGTKITSHQFLKQKLTNENKKLKEAISQIKEVSLNDIQEGRKQRISNDESWSQRKSRLIELEKAAQNEKAKIKKQIEKTKSENGDMRVEVAKINLEIEDRKKIIAEAEEHVDLISDDINSLNEELNRLKYELEMAKNSNNSLSSIQKYKKTNTSLMMEKKRLINEIEELKKKNNMLNVQISSRKKE